METCIKHMVVSRDKKIVRSSEHMLIGEEPLSIYVEGKPYSVVMRTPGDELVHAAGFCLGEGIVDTPDDFNTISSCDDIDPNVVTVTISKSRLDKITGLLDRRGFISQTSCGICGKEIVKDLYQKIQPIKDNTRIDVGLAVQILENLSQHQPLRDKTRASHAAALYAVDFKLLSSAEDVGRHNALDKAIGKLFLDRKLDEAVMLVLSSRISYELVQKAARARLPVILAFSRPTSLAVELASELNMTLACLAEDSGLYIYCKEKRLTI
ncbi:MAG: formate dehydrogenase accessory sulfurtransferase FdhD [Deltaproteobacteria bacterium]|nr:formate dehydrogenase accessory sulfurtransferase FdhD [Deltaproteobacteria bacterium]MBW2668978.1 formate dehydrogenase accessory sulfurtransferase FdhD [Deltaproteobacteria bacterium]